MLYQSNWNIDSKIGYSEIMVVCDLCGAVVTVVNFGNYKRIWQVAKEEENLCMVCRLKAKFMPDII